MSARTHGRWAAVPYLIAAILCAAVVAPAPAHAATQKVEVQTVRARSLNGTLWVEGLIRNPTQTALTDVIVVVKRISSTGRTVSVFKGPANCIVLDGLATTTFTLKRALSARTLKAKSVVVSVSGTPTFRRPVWLAASLYSQGGASTYHEFTVEVRNDQPRAVTGTLVFGQHWTYGWGDTSHVLTDVLRGSSLSGLRLESGETTSTRIRVSQGLSFVRANVFAEAIASRQSGIDMETTEVLVGYGQPAVIRGTIRSDLTRAGVPSAKVVFRTSLDGSNWSDPTTVTASSHGRFSVPVSATELKLYSFETPGRSGVLAPSGPVVVRVYPRVVLSTPVALPSTVMTYSVVGTVSPCAGPEAAGVRLLCYRKVNDEWLLDLVVSPTVMPEPSGNATYEAVVRFPTPGQWRIAAAIDADAEHAYTVSKMRSLRLGVTTLEVSASRSTVSYLHSSRLTVTLLADGRRPLPGRYVVCEFSENGGGSYRWLSGTLTDDSGRVSFKVKPTSTTRYQFRWAGEDEYERARSIAKTIKSTAVTRTLSVPIRLWKGPYFRDVHLRAGTYQISADAPFEWQIVGASPAVHGVTSGSGANHSDTFTIRRGGTFTFKLNCGGFRTPPPDTIRVMIW